MPKRVPPDDFAKRFGTLMDRWLTDRGKPRKALADELRKTPSTVTSWVKGRNVPNLRMFWQLVGILGLTRQEVLEVFGLRPR